MMGDRAVLERYREARGRYEESEREVARQGQDLQRAQIELNRVRREVTRLEEWERAAEKVFDLERRRNEAAQKLPELRTKLKNASRSPWWQRSRARSANPTTPPPAVRPSTARIP